jgi:hypothetical protein
MSAPCGRSADGADGKQLPFDEIENRDAPTIKKETRP